MNLKEFAAHLQVSQTTVSRALNGHPEVNAKTRQRIVAEAKRLSYEPSSAALRLATGRSGAFGIFLTMDRSLLREPTFRDFLVGLFEALSKENKDLIMAPTHGNQVQEYERFYSRGRVDAFAVIRPLLTDSHILEHLVQKKIPFVLHGYMDIGQPYSYVTIDNRGAFRKLTTLLLDLGHARIALLNEELRYWFADERLQAFRAALTERGLAADPALECEFAMNEANAYTVTRQLLAMPNPPTALVCGNMLGAQGAYRAIRDLGLEPGRDISVVAHDDVSSEVNAELFQPALTATTSSLTEAGRKVGTFLLALMAGVSPESLQVSWQPALTYRDSAQPVNAKSRRR